MPGIIKLSNFDTCIKLFFLLTYGLLQQQCCHANDIAASSAARKAKSQILEASPKSVKSDQWQTVTKRPRIVSFAPSCTELVEAINAQDNIVGVCKFCEIPKSLEAKIERVGDFNTANIERLIRLKPDMVLAVSGQDALIHSLEHNKLIVTTFQNSKLADISNNLRTIGKLTGHQEAANAEALKFDSAIKDLRMICQRSTEKRVMPSVFFCVWPQPLLTAGKSSFLNDAVSACGARNVAADLTAAYPHFSLEKLVLVNPDIIIMPYEAKSEQYLNRAPWNTLRAFKEHRLYFLEKEESDRLSRPSTRVVKGLYWLATKLHPEEATELSEWLKSNAELEKIDPISN